MANPELNTFDTNGTNTTPITATKQTDGFAIEETVPSAVHNEMFKQLFAAANKAKLDGAWDWETDLTYRKGALVWYNDTLWKSIASANQGNTPVTGAFWKEPGIEDAVSLTGNQTIDGIKTFNSSPIAPTPAVGDNSTKVATTAFVQANAGVDVATSAEIRTGTNNTKSITPLGYTETTLGWGQTWQDVTVSRSAGVTYTNTSGKPIQVIIQDNGTLGAQVTITINGTITFSDTQGSGVTKPCVYAIIPNGNTYSATFSGNGGYQFFELI